MIHVSLVLFALICSQIYVWNLASAELYSGGDENVSLHAVHNQCSEQNLTIMLTSRLIPNLQHATFNASNKQCEGKHLNSTHVIFSFKAAECGTTRRTSTNGSRVYSNLLTLYFKEHNQSQKLTQILRLECTIYNNVTAIISSSNLLQDATNTKNVTASDEAAEVKGTDGEQDGQTEISRSLKLPTTQTKMGTFRFFGASRFIETENGQKTTAKPSPGEAHPTNTSNVTNPEGVTFAADQSAMTAVRHGVKVTFQAQLQEQRNGNTRFELAIKDCYTSPNATQRNATQDGQLFIKSGCEIKPRLCNFIFKRHSLSQEFSFKIVKSHFKEAKTLFIHCTFVRCDGREPSSACAVGCRGTRKVMQFKKGDLIHSTVGPFTGEFPEKALSAAESRMLVTVTAMVLIFAVICVSFLIIYCIFCRRRKHKRSDRLLENEADASVLQCDTSPGSNCSAVFEDLAVKSSESTNENDTYAILGGGKNVLNMNWTKL
ncbi:uncharacterized protein [Montipora capricornis]|uniref:uncharacterized protein n=1 Tax=Montipora capricornis TaxID=246305 RepID=UPI0035F12838